MVRLIPSSAYFPPQGEGGAQRSREGEGLHGWPPNPSSSHAREGARGPLLLPMGEGFTLKPQLSPQLFCGDAAGAEVGEGLGGIAFGEALAVLAQEQAVMAVDGGGKFEEGL